MITLPDVQKPSSGSSVPSYGGTSSSGSSVKHHRVPEHFGVPLAELLSGTLRVPRLLITLTEYLIATTLPNSATSPGAIFDDRTPLPPDVKAVVTKGLLNHLDSPQLAAAALRTWLRQLPTPLLPEAAFGPALALVAAHVLSCDSAVRKTRYHRTLTATADGNVNALLLSLWHERPSTTPATSSGNSSNSSSPSSASGSSSNLLDKSSSRLSNSAAPTWMTSAVDAVGSMLATPWEQRSASQKILCRFSFSIRALPSGFDEAFLTLPRPHRDALEVLALAAAKIVHAAGSPASVPGVAAALAPHVLRPAVWGASSPSQKAKTAALQAAWMQLLILWVSKKHNLLTPDETAELALSDDAAFRALVAAGLPGKLSTTRKGPLAATSSGSTEVTTVESMLKPPHAPLEALHRAATILATEEASLLSHNDSAQLEGGSSRRIGGGSGGGAPAATGFDITTSSSPEVPLSLPVIPRALSSSPSLSSSNIPVPAFAPSSLVSSSSSSARAGSSLEGTPFSPPVLHGIASPSTPFTLSKTHGPRVMPDPPGGAPTVLPTWPQDSVDAATSGFSALRAWVNTPPSAPSATVAAAFPGLLRHKTPSGTTPQSTPRKVMSTTAPGRGLLPLMNAPPTTPPPPPSSAAALAVNVDNAMAFPRTTFSTPSSSSGSSLNSPAKAYKYDLEPGFLNHTVPPKSGGDRCTDCGYRFHALSLTRRRTHCGYCSRLYCSVCVEPINILPSDAVSSGGTGTAAARSVCSPCGDHLRRCRTLPMLDWSRFTVSAKSKLNGSSAEAARAAVRTSLAFYLAAGCPSASVLAAVIPQRLAPFLADPPRLATRDVAALRSGAHVVALSALAHLLRKHVDNCITCCHLRRYCCAGAFCMSTLQARRSAEEKKSSLVKKVVGGIGADGAPREKSIGSGGKDDSDGRSSLSLDVSSVGGVSSVSMAASMAASLPASMLLSGKDVEAVTHCKRCREFAHVQCATRARLCYACAEAIANNKT